MEDYLKKILQAQVYEVAKKTPLEKANNLSKALKNNIYLKREDLQDVFSFKIRGAFNKMRQLTQAQLHQQSSNHIYCLKSENRIFLSLNFFSNLLNFFKSVT